MDLALDDSGDPDLAIRCDVTEAASVDSAIAEVVGELGRLDVGLRLPT